MSVTDILSELPKLDPAELQLVFERTLELHEKVVFVPSPELAEAIREAEAEPEEDSIDIDEARRIVKSWSSESSSRKRG
jgi:hypothetical protein